jgi:hypothetical protein
LWWLVSRSGAGVATAGGTFDDTRGRKARIQALIASRIDTDC